MENETVIRVWYQGGRIFFTTYEKAAEFVKTHNGARIDGTKGEDGRWYSY